MKIIFRKYIAYFSILAFALVVVAGVYHHWESTQQLYICYAKGAVLGKNLAKVGSFSPALFSPEELFNLNFVGFVSTDKTVPFEFGPFLSNSSRAPPSIF